MVTKIKPYRIRDVNEPEEGNSLQYNDPNTFARGEGGGGGGGSSSWGHITGTLSNQTDLQDALDEKQDELIAGDNIQIAQDGKTISATDTTYTAGTGINIDSNNVISSTATSAQWGNITGTLSNQTDLQNALDSKVNLGINKVFDSTVVEIGKWEHEPGGDSSGHHIELDPSGEVSTYNLTTAGHNEATLGSGTLELLNNTVLDGNKTATFDHEKIVADDGTDTETYNFFGNNRIARLSDLDSGVNTKTFFLNREATQAEKIATLQEVYDWIKDGTRNAIIEAIDEEAGNLYPDKTFILSNIEVSEASGNPTVYDFQNGFVSDFTQPTLRFYVLNNTVTNYGYDYKRKIARAGNGINITRDRIINTLPGPTIAATAPSSPTEGMLWYDTTNDKLKVYDGTNWNVTGKEYNAGEGISIGTVQDYSAMQGPAPDGFHVPLSSEWQTVYDILIITFGLASNATTMGTYLKLPMAGNRRYNNADVSNVGSYGLYWSSTPFNANYAYILSFSSSDVSPQSNDSRSNGFSVRCFKNSPTIPAASWTTLYDGSSIASGAGVFYNATDGLISVSGNGTTWYTIMDKNLGATTVFNQGDTVNDANCGYFFQRGNNYGFAHSGTVTTSSTQVDASTYGPGNYYNSSTFITRSSSPYDWSSVQNDDLWGGVSQGTWVGGDGNTIVNTGVLSVNGQTGNVTIPTAEESNTKTFYLSSTSDLTTAQAAYDWYKAGKNPIIRIFNRTYDVYELTSGNLVYKYFDGVQRDVTGGGKTLGYLYTLTFNISSDSVISVTETAGTQSGFLQKDNSSAFTPTGNYNPATKKYVDDSVSGAVSKGTTAPSSPVEGQLWYDTTNDVLKVYNGTTWVEVGGGITNDTTGTTSTISQEWVGTKAEFNALSSYGNKIYNIIE